MIETLIIVVIYVWAGLWVAIDAARERNAPRDRPVVFIAGLIVIFLAWPIVLPVAVITDKK